MISYLYQQTLWQIVKVVNFITKYNIIDQSVFRSWWTAILWEGAFEFFWKVKDPPSFPQWTAGSYQISNSRDIFIFSLESYNIPPTRSMLADGETRERDGVLWCIEYCGECWGWSENWLLSVSMFKVSPMYNCASIILGTKGQKNLFNLIEVKTL